MIIPSRMCLVSGVLATAEEGCKCWKQRLGPQLFSCSHHKCHNSDGFNRRQYQRRKICLQEQQGASLLSFAGFFSCLHRT